MSYSVKLVLVVNQILFKGNPTTLNSFYSLSNPNLTPIFESEPNVADDSQKTFPLHRNWIFYFLQPLQKSKPVFMFGFVFYN